MPCAVRWVKSRTIKRYVPVCYLISEKVIVLEKVNNLEAKVTYFRDECTNPGNLMVR